MSQFEYLSVLVSIIIGLGLSHLLASAARLIQVRRRVRLYWPTCAQMGALFLVQIQIWWAAFERRNESNWNFFSFLLYLLIPVLVALLSYLIVPDLDEEQEVNLRASYYENRQWFFGLLAAAPVISLTEEYVLDYAAGEAIRPDADAVYRVAFFALALAAALIRKEAYHFFSAFLLLGLVLAYIFTLFLQLA